MAVAVGLDDRPQLTSTAHEPARVRADRAKVDLDAAAGH